MYSSTKIAKVDILQEEPRLMGSIFSSPTIYRRMIRTMLGSQYSKSESSSPSGIGLRVPSQRGTAFTGFCERCKRQPDTGRQR